MSKSIELSPGALTLAQLRQIWQEPTVLTLPPEAIGAMDASSAIVAKIIREGNPAYGINTGFGKLAQQRIPDHDLEQLQKNLILSHSVGVGEPVSDAVARLIMAMKIASLARGFFGHTFACGHDLVGYSECRRGAFHSVQGFGGRIG